MLLKFFLILISFGMISCATSTTEEEAILNTPKSNSDNVIVVDKIIYDASTGEITLYDNKISLNSKDLSANKTTLLPKSKNLEKKKFNSTIYALQTCY